MNRYYILGKQIHLGKLIGEGGEGRVYEHLHDSSKVIKIYSDLSNSHRENKIKKMISLEFSKKTNLISFPDEAVTNESGQVIGFSMNYLSNYQQIHNLYGVKSRKQLFPNADYRFLVRVATNVAKAIAQIHTYPCVIGDINHSGVLVSKNATVALIDADSFQIKDNGTIYPCVVGVPDFTPPELQGRSLKNIERTQVHDQFGLAVLIFQILVMGRHPFAGRGRELSLEECIQQYLFAYTKKSSTGIIPPPGVPLLDEFPYAIQNAFEYSFSNKSSLKRTSASEWISLLEEMENSLVKCSVNAKHFYSSNADHCSWCKMESATGAILFNGGITLISSSITMKDIDQILTDVLSFNVDELKIFPKPPSIPLQMPSWEAKAAKAKKMVNKILFITFSTFMAISIIALFFTQNIITLALSVLLGWFAHHFKSNNDEVWVQKFKNLEDHWDLKLHEWREKITIRIFQTKYNIEKAVKELKELDKEKEFKLKKLGESHRERQLQEYLDKYFIKNANIRSISPSLVAYLESCNIESAADIEYNKIRNLPKFGDVRTGNLVTWRRELEKKFHYNPSLQSQDISSKNQIINEFELKMREKKSYLEQQKKTFDQLRTDFYKIIQVEDKELSQVYLEKENLKFDLQFLYIAVPSLVSKNRPFNKPIFNQSPTNNTNQWGNGANAQNQHIPSCPRCNSLMVSRWSHRGSFWGCSRYPQCKGTRNY